MATKIKKSTDEEEEELLREENERRTTEARSKVPEIREKSKERGEDDRRKRALESIHRMEWLKNKDDLSVLQCGTKVKPRGRKKDRVEVIKNLQDLGLPPCEPPPPCSKYVTPPPPSQNAWSMKPGSALFPNTTAATMVTLKLKDYDEEAMLRKAIEESLSHPEEGFMYNPKEYGDVSPWAPSSKNESPRLARSLLGQELPRNENPWVHGQGNAPAHSIHGQRNDIGHTGHGQSNDIGHSGYGQRNDIGHSGHGQRGDIGHSGHGQRNDIGHSDYGQRNDIRHSGHGQRNDIIHSVQGQRNDLRHTDHRPRNDIDLKPEINNQSSRQSPTMRHCFAPPVKEFKEKDSDTTEKTDSTNSSGGKTDAEVDPIDYYKKGKELAEKRARERALKFAAQEAENMKNEKVAQENQEDVPTKTEHKSSPGKNVRFSPDGDSNNEDAKEAAQTLADTRASIERLFPEPERLTETLKVPDQDKVECQPLQVPGDQRQFWKPIDTQVEAPLFELPQPDSTTLTPPQEVSTTNETTSTQRLYTPEDFIVMDNDETPQMPDMDQLSLGYVAGLDQYSAYMGYPYGIGAYPDMGALPQYVGNPTVQTLNSFPDVTSSSFMQPSAVPLMNNSAQNMYAAVPDGLQTSIASQHNATNPTVKVTSTSPQNMSPNYVMSNPLLAAQNYCAASMSSPNMTAPVAIDGSSTREVNANYQVPASSPGVPVSTPSSVQMIPNVPAQNYRNVDRWLQLNILLSQCLMNQLSGVPMLGGNVSMDALSALMPTLPNVPQTTPADVMKPAPPPPVPAPNIRLPYSLPQAPVNPSQSALLTTTEFQPIPNAVSCLPSVQAVSGYAHVQPPQRMPGSFIRGPSGRGRGIV